MNSCTVRSWWSGCFDYIKRRCRCCDIELGKSREPAASQPAIAPTSNVDETTPLLSYPGLGNQQLPSSSSADYLSRRWPTHWYWQFLVLTVRTFRHARRTILSVLRMIQTLFLAVICSLLWFQVPYEEQHIFDRYGYVSSSSTYTGH